MTKKIVGAVTTALLLSTIAHAADVTDTQTVEFNIDSSIALVVSDVGATTLAKNTEGNAAIGTNKLSVTANGDYNVTVAGENGGYMKESTAAASYVNGGKTLTSQLKASVATGTGGASWTGPEIAELALTGNAQKIFAGSNTSTTAPAELTVNLNQPLSADDRGLVGDNQYRMTLTYTVVAGL